MPQLETEVIIRNGRVVGGSSSGVTDVQVNGTSVVSGGVAQITETDQNVLQTQDDNTYNNFEILLAGSTSTSTTTEGAKKTSSLVFNPSQQAITIGSRKANSTIGTNSFASGNNVEASGSYAHAEGAFTTASSNFDHAEGSNTTASGGCAHAEGNNTTASGGCAHAEGGGTKASGTYSHAEGYSTKASGAQSHAEGTNTTASSQNAHAEGLSTTASGSYSHTEGYYTTASGDQSHAEGSSTTASGNQSHAEGGGTKADGSCAHAEGGGTTASGDYTHAEGLFTMANHRGQHVFGEYNIADPSTTIASSRGDYVEIVGNGTSLSTRSNARTLDWDGNEVLSGKLTVGTAPTNNMDVTTKQYVDTELASADEIIEINATDYDALSYAEKHNGKYYHITDRNSSNELDTKVTQTQDDSTNATYEVLLAGSTSATTATESAKKSSGLTYNPNTSVLSMSGTPSGNTDVVTKAYADGKVDKTGDTMTGDLTVEKSNGYFVSKNPNITINTSANNGVTSSQTEGYMIKDSANNDIARFLSVQETNGDVITQIAAFNKKTDGTATNNYINATVKKDGTRTYTVADPAAFRTAIDTDYKYWNEFTKTALSLPSSWREILIQVMYNGSFMTATYTNAMIDTERSVSFGNYGTSYAVGNLSKTQIKLTIVNWAGSDVTSSAKGYVYYK